MPIVDQLAAFIADTTLADIPPETQAYAKHLGVKTAAGMVAGSNQPTGKRIIKYVADQDINRTDAGVIGANFQTDVRHAVLANATLAHVSELEDDKITPGQDTAWDITTFPVIFPLAERYKLSGKTLLEAAAIGLEVHTRVSIPPNRNASWRKTQEYGCIAPAAVAAKALGLSTAEIKHALGIAIGGGCIFIPNIRTDAHYFDSTFQCLRGLQAAELANAGFTGNPDLEGLYANIDPDATPELVIENIGDVWEFHNIGVKKYPCCFHTHRFIDTLLELVTEHDLENNDIADVTIEVGQRERDMCDRPNPTHNDDAKFSFQQVLSAVIIDRDVNYNHLEDDALTAPEFAQTREKITVNTHEDWIQPFIEPATITITTTTGDTYTHERMHMIGSKQDPLTEQEFRDLYRKFTQPVLTDDIVDRSADRLFTIEDQDDLTPLMHLLTYNQPLTTN